VFFFFLNLHILNAQTSVPMFVNANLQLADRVGRKSL